MKKKHKFVILFLSILTYIIVLGAQKNCLIVTVVLSTNNICFGWEIRKFQVCINSKDLSIVWDTYIMRPKYYENRQEI